MIPAVVLLMLMLQGCISEPVAGSVDRATLHLSLSIITESASVTRAHSDDSEEDGTAAESRIDFDNNDMRIFLLTNSGAFLQELAVSPSEWEHSEGTGRSMHSFWNKEIFLSEETDADRAVVEGIRRDGLNVIVLANSRNANWHANNEAVNFPGTMSGLWKDGTNFNYNYVPGAEMTSWRPTVSGSAPNLIPMFGYSHVDFYESATGNHHSTAAVKMQRAMAKVEVIDNIEWEGASISAVSMSDYNQVGRLIPDVEANPGWDKVGSQVEVSSIPADPANIKQELKFFRYPEDPKKWVAYIPEMKLDKPSANGTLPDSRSHINLTVSAPGTEFDGEVYPVHFAYYQDNITPVVSDESWNHVLRNHIYRFSINKIGVNAELELHVKPWELDDDESWDYTDHVTVAQMLEWKSGTFESLDSESGRLLLWIDKDKEKILTGTFRIKTPVNGRWVARLTSLDDAHPNAVTFVDIDGNPMEPSHGNPPVCHEVSGIIEQETPATIRIMPTNFGNDEISAFKLEFFVENLGSWMPVRMVNEKDGTFDYYIIVRKGNKIES